MNNTTKTVSIVSGILAIGGILAFSIKKSHDIGYDQGAKRVCNDMIFGNGLTIDVDGKRTKCWGYVDKDILYDADNYEITNVIHEK